MSGSVGAKMAHRTHRVPDLYRCNWVAMLKGSGTDLVYPTPYSNTRNEQQWTETNVVTEFLFLFHLSATVCLFSYVWIDLHKILFHVPKQYFLLYKVELYFDVVLDIPTRVFKRNVSNVPEFHAHSFFWDVNKEASGRLWCVIFHQIKKINWLIKNLLILSVIVNCLGFIVSFIARSYCDCLFRMHCSYIWFPFFCTLSTSPWTCYLWNFAHFLPISPHLWSNG